MRWLIALALLLTGCAADDAPITESSTGLCGQIEETRSCTGTGEDSNATIRWGGDVDCDDTLRTFEACDLVREDVTGCFDAIDSCEMCNSPVSGEDTAPCLMTDDDDSCERLIRCQLTGSVE